ncbi:hypothetical protein [Blastopirellula marina]|uniref:Uncharacterized protein n=1 Tax=Blastopirellula marina TaxID=124 RepID=A0A2S8G6G2_9BACT|nr:hypothetical protein [Blastopirellula marina]PQO40055.1 hypothetical protein C5Y98_07000 [Blastopirellula marina]PTL45430.1 hypothetical protein C5Y97_07000 [Blastopirellula marina]
MINRILYSAAILSTAMLILSIALFLLGYAYNPWEYRLTLQDDFHIGVWTEWPDSRIVFFNDSDHGPYIGSIIALRDSDRDVYPTFVREERFGPTAGIYYRYFERIDSKLWTLMVSLWYPILFFAIISGTTIAGILWRRRKSISQVT